VPDITGGLTVQLGGSLSVISQLGIPDPPVFGAVFASGGISIGWKPACPKDGIKFSLSGYLALGFRLGVYVVGQVIDIASIVLEVGVKKKWFKAVDKVVNVGPSYRRRRGVAQKTKIVRTKGYCDIVVYGKVTLTVLCVRIWLLGEYQIRTKKFVMSFGADYYQVYKLWWGNWVNLVSINMIDMEAGDDKVVVAPPQAYPPGR